MCVGVDDSFMFALLDLRQSSRFSLSSSAVSLTAGAADSLALRGAAFLDDVPGP